MYDNKIKLKILNMYHFIKVVNFHYLCTASIIIHFFFFLSNNIINIDDSTT